MLIKMNPRNQFPGRGPCIEMLGDWVTEDVWNVVNRLMLDNWITSPVYQARHKAQAFFQGGSGNSKGKWILIEFWKKEEECADFIKILNEEVNKAINKNFTLINLIARSNNERNINEVEEASKLIAEETGCEMEMGEKVALEHKCRVIFTPKDNVTYRAVSLLVDYTFSLKRLHWLDKWEIK